MTFSKPIAFLLVLYLAACADGLRCYTCLYHPGQVGHENDCLRNPKRTNLVLCDARAAGSSIRHKEHTIPGASLKNGTKGDGLVRTQLGVVPACTTWKGLSGDEVVRVERACSFAYENDLGRCVEEDSEFEINCFCNTDGCNSDPVSRGLQLGISTSLFVFTTVMTTFIYHC